MPTATEATAATAPSAVSETTAVSAAETAAAGTNATTTTTSAVYFAEGYRDDAADVLAEANIDEIDEPTAMPREFATEDAAIIVLLGTDTAPATARQQSELRPRQRNDIQLPLPVDTPRDRYVPGLADINIYSQINDQGSLDLQAKLEEVSIYLRYIGNYQPYVGATAENRDTQGTFRTEAPQLPSPQRFSTTPMRPLPQQPTATHSAMDSVNVVWQQPTPKIVSKLGSADDLKMMANTVSLVASSPVARFAS